MKKKETKEKKEIVLWDPNWLKSITNLFKKINDIKLKLPNIGRTIPAPPSKRNFDFPMPQSKHTSSINEMTDEKLIKRLTGQDSSYLTPEAKQAFKKIIHDRRFGSTSKQPNPQPYVAQKRKSTTIQSYTKNGETFLHKEDIIKFIRNEATSFEGQGVSSSNRELRKTGQTIGKVLRIIASNIEKGVSSQIKEE